MFFRLMYWNRTFAEPFRIRPYYAGVSLGIVYRPRL